MATLSDLTGLLTSVGAPPALVRQLAAIPFAEDPSGGTTPTQEPDGSQSVGWWQINSANWSWLTQYFGTPVNAATLADPTLNAKAAVAIATQTPNGLANWSTWNAYTDAQAGATGLTAAQKNAAVTIAQVLNGNASTTQPPVIGGGSIPDLVNGGGLAGFIAGLGALIQGQGWDAANKSAQDTTKSAAAMQAEGNATVNSLGKFGWNILSSGWWKSLTTPQARAVIATALGILLLIYFLTRSTDSETNVTLAAPAAAGAA